MSRLEHTDFPKSHTILALRWWTPELTTSAAHENAAHLSAPKNPLPRKIIRVALKMPVVPQRPHNATLEWWKSGVHCVWVALSTPIFRKATQHQHWSGEHWNSSLRWLVNYQRPQRITSEDARHQPTTPQTFSSFLYPQASVDLIDQQSSTQLRCQHVLVPMAERLYSYTYIPFG